LLPKTGISTKAQCTTHTEKRPLLNFCFCNWNVWIADISSGNWTCC